jgi:hypothetical protein
MQIFNFLAANWDSVVVIVAFIGLAIYLVKKGKTDALKQILFALVTEAERQYGSGTGVLKKATVITWIYERLPLIIRIFFTEKQLEVMIESVLTEAKSKWADNESLKLYVEGTAAATAEATEEAKPQATAEENAK